MVTGNGTDSCNTHSKHHAKFCSLDTSCTCSLAPGHRNPKTVSDSSEGILKKLMKIKALFSFKLDYHNTLLQYLACYSNMLLHKTRQPQEGKKTHRWLPVVFHWQYLIHSEVLQPDHLRRVKEIQTLLYNQLTYETIPQTRFSYWTCRNKYTCSYVFTGSRLICWHFFYFLHRRY